MEIKKEEKKFLSKEEIKKIEKTKKIIVKNLLSNNSELITNAIELMHEYGEPSMIPLLLQTLNKNKDNEQIINSVFNFLFDLKNQDTIPFLMEAIQDDKLKQFRKLLVSVFWQAGFDLSDYINDLVDIAINNDYLVALEVLTTFDQMKGPFIEENLYDAKFSLETAIEKENTEKKALLIEIKKIIENFIENNLIPL